MTNYFSLAEPVLESDWHSCFVNGLIWDSRRQRIPDVSCPRCRSTWGGWKSLPWRVPAELRHWKYLNDHDAVHALDHARIRAEVERAYRRRGIDARGLIVPGASFAPLKVRSSSIPEYDFLWPSLNVIVSQRVRRMLRGLEGVDFAPVVFTRMGRRRVTATVHQTGEPEDQVIRLRQPPPKGVPAYSQLIVSATAKVDPKLEPTPRCKLCGSERFRAKNAEVRMSPKLWRGHELFTVPPCAGLVVTERLRDRLLAADVTNVAITPI